MIDCCEQECVDYYIYLASKVKKVVETYQGGLAFTAKYLYRFSFSGIAETA